MRVSERAPIDIEIVDVSVSGAAFLTRADVTVGTEISIGIPGLPLSQATVVRQIDGGYACEFSRAISPALLDQAGRQNIVGWPKAPQRAPQPAEAAEPVVEKWPGVVRVPTAIALGAIAWAALYALTQIL
jgi:hypothetical protein